MAHQIRAFQVSVPANTAQAAPFAQDVSFPPMTVDAVRYRIPGGASGNMGWRLTSGGVQVLPHNIGAWLVSDGESDKWDMEGLHDSGQWELTAYNTDLYPHTIYLTFHLSLITQRWHPVELFSTQSLAPVPDLSQAGPPIVRRR